MPLFDQFRPLLQYAAIVYRVVDQANPYSEAKADRKSPPSRLP